jgi:hypothetical protein
MTRRARRCAATPARCGTSLRTRAQTDVPATSRQLPLIARPPFFCAAMRPGTTDYSRWDNINTSSDDEAPPPPPPPPRRAPAAAADSAPKTVAAAPPPAAPPQEELAAPARAQTGPADVADDDALSAVLPVLLAHSADALRLLGSGASNPKADDPFLDAALPADLAAALRAVTRANDAVRRGWRR